MGKKPEQGIDYRARQGWSEKDNSSSNNQGGRERGWEGEKGPRHGYTERCIWLALGVSTFTMGEGRERKEEGRACLLF